MSTEKEIAMVVLGSCGCLLPPVCDLVGEYADETWLCSYRSQLVFMRWTGPISPAFGCMNISRYDRLVTLTAFAMFGVGNGTEARIETAYRLPSAIRSTVTMEYPADVLYDDYFVD
jgi:hypothetical protein